MSHNNIQGKLGNVSFLAPGALLDLSDNHLHGVLPSQFNRPDLDFLDLSSNNISGSLEPFLCSGIQEPRQLRVLNIGAFLLYDVLFQNIVLGRASLVTKGRVSTYDNILYLVSTLDLSNNKFSGSIPDELVSLLGLRYLNLSHNNLTGRIPNLFSKSGVLESLDLSVNHLDGKFPSSLSALTTLNFLSVSYNNLVGRIPTGSQLQTLNESSFIGNALCDYPLPACSQNNGNPRGTKDKHGFRRREPRNEILFSNDQVQKFDLSRYIYSEPKGYHEELSSEASSSIHKIQQSD
ncbi:hypothetical protein E3N88_38694 [Mikania micrantha]|uniref:Leucine-rich repeat-containing N-terminal plant-type domain-containing protein n=1 Tax=Mikania micrantha TaxID=192012 RepID=A0A5N6LUS1_9ASTR|nr:hypothetical protein E3N88_38694 [Mikania micrantha]